MKYKLSEHKNEIITHIIKNLIWLPIASIIPIISTIVFKIINNKDIEIITIIMLFISTIFSAIALVFVIKLKKDLLNGNNNLNTNTDDIKDVIEDKIIPLINFRINSIDIELDFEDRVNIISTLNYKMTANEDDIDYFEKELIWTGKDYHGTTMTQANGNYELELFDSNDSLHKYRVNFLEPIKKQDLIKFELKTKVSDSNRTMQPFSSYMVKHQVDNLTLRVTAPPHCITNVKQATYIDLYRQVQVGTSRKVIKRTIGGKECYEVQIPNPTLAYRYFLEWEFTK